ncbi:Gtp binding protein [Pleurostoma richardsiae]|uniref:Gtp binding protein n=1 Tax=Pleurostoma richardsiae TaxID=41990 RepID=A0AA38RM62_9PEZI|nr:Gtp binding protein [Pleurostoma richardsiae]
MSPDEIESLFQETGTAVIGDLGDVDRLPLTEGQRKYRTARLSGVARAAQHAWLAASDEIDIIAEKVGDGSRDPSWRLPLGDSGLVDFFLGILAADNLRLPLKVHALRVIGNACADTDENRARVVESKRLLDIIRLLADDSILAFVIPVLYNICVDYEPAQLQACGAGLSRELVGILSGPRLTQCEAFINIMCKILAFLVAQTPEAKLANPVTPVILLRVATNPALPVDLEDFLGLVSVALGYLAQEEFQMNLLGAGGLHTFLGAFANAYTHYNMVDLDPDDAAQLKDIRNAFVQVLADMSALESFPSMHPLNSPVVQTLQSWLRTPSSYANLQTAACLALGNLARSDEISTSLVRDYQTQLPLIALLSTPYPTLSGQQHADSPLPSQLLHAILSFLKNLAIPASNKPALGGLLEQPTNILPRLWNSTDTQPQTQFAAVSLTRLLLVGCPANVKRICAPLSLDPSSPAHDRSNLHVLGALFDRVDSEPTKMEASRAVAVVCRVLHSTPVLPILPEDWGLGDGGYIFKGRTSPVSNFSEPSLRLQSGESRRARFYEAHADINKPLSFLVQQTRFPALRSEAWFIFALMSRSSDGVRVVVRALHPFEACRALVEAVSGRDMVDGHDLLTGTPSMPPQDDDAKLMRSIDSLRTHRDSAGLDTQENPERLKMVVGLEGLGLEPQQADPEHAVSMGKIDRENGLVLLAEVLRNYGDHLPPFRRSVFEELLRTGGELVLHQRLQVEGQTSEQSGAKFYERAGEQPKFSH